jgi:pimeloyl-ACP methyl ester carboxylesterase
MVDVIPAGRTPFETNAPIYALHASASNGGQWAALAREQEMFRRVETPDLPGCGRAPWTRRAGLTGLGADAEPVIRRIERERRPAHLVGHSYGGAVALWIAMNRPELVLSLSVYEPATFHILRDSASAKDRRQYARIAAVASQLRAATAAGRPDVGMRCFVDFWNGAGAWDAMGPEGQARMSARAPRVAADFAAGLGELWALEALGHLTVPTMVMLGLESCELTQRAATMIAGAVPGAQLVMVPEADHMAPVTDPRSVNPRIALHVATADRAFEKRVRPLPAAA